MIYFFHQRDTIIQNLASMGQLQSTSTIIFWYMMYKGFRDGRRFTIEGSNIVGCPTESGGVGLKRRASYFWLMRYVARAFRNQVLNQGMSSITLGTFLFCSGAQFVFHSI